MPQMKLGFIGDNDLPSVEADARFAKEHGFEGLEYNHWGSFKDLTRETVDRMRDILDRQGIRVSMLGLWGWNHLHPDPAQREVAHAMLGRAIEYAHVLKADHLVTGAGDMPNEPVGRKVREFARVFPPFLEQMKSKGVKPLFYAVHGASFLDSIATYERVWETELGEDVRIKFDPANWLHHGDDYLDVLKRYGSKIGYVHIKDHLYHNTKLASQPPAGQGDIAWGKVFAFLYEHNYTGWLSIEPHGPIWGRGEMRKKMLLLTKRYIGQFMI
jgi:sugar phosphate isomerase/epimerase